jgi:hypothetical protein
MGGVRRVRLPAEVAPIVLLDVDAVVLRRLLDVGEGEVAVFVGDTLDLVEAGQGVLDVGSVRQRLFALLGERVGVSGSSCRSLLESSPCSVCGFHVVLVAIKPVPPRMLSSGAVLLTAPAGWSGTHERY